MNDLNKRFVLELVQDDYPSNPRNEYDHLGRMVCFHSRYQLGDELHYRFKKGEGYAFDYEGRRCPPNSEEGGEDAYYHFYGEGKFADTLEVHMCLKAIDEEGGVVLPLYLYDHSGISISTSEFGCPWDSGQIGYIYMTRATIEEHFNGKKKDALLCLKSEVEEYDTYLRGDVWGYKILDTEEDDEEIDSCHGFYGREDAEEEGESILKSIIKEEEKKLHRERVEEAEIEAYREDDRFNELKALEYLLNRI